MGFRDSDREIESTEDLRPELEQTFSRLKTDTHCDVYIFILFIATYNSGKGKAESGACPAA